MTPAISTPRPSSVGLAAAVAISVLVHAAGGIALVTHDRATPRPAVVSPPDATPPRDEAPLGITDSLALSLDWLGFAEPTPHTGDQAEVNQAEVSPNPGQTRSPINAEAAPSPESSPSATKPTPDQVVDAETPPDATDLPIPDAQPGDVAPVRTGTPTPTPETPSPKPEPPAPEAPAPRPTERTPDRPEDGAAEATVAPDRPAIEDERDSPATAAEPLDVPLNGRPIAREGLQIRTVRPEFAIFATLSRAPRNPVVAVSFGPDGRAKKVEFVRDPETKQEQDAGATYFNEPVLNALYLWRASGPRIEALKDLPAEGGANRETITVRIVLRR